MKTINKIWLLLFAVIVFFCIISLIEWQPLDVTVLYIGDWFNAPLESMTIGDVIVAAMLGYWWYEITTGRFFEKRSDSKEAFRNELDFYLKCEINRVRAMKSDLENGSAEERYYRGKDVAFNEIRRKFGNG